MRPDVENYSRNIVIEESILHKIVARQRTARSKMDALPSPLTKLISHSEWKELLEVMPASKRNALAESLLPVREKIQKKWWGPQGRSLQVDTAALLNGYDTPNQFAEASTNSYETRTGWGILWKWLHPLRDEGRYKKYCSQRDNPQFLYSYVQGKPKSNSGYTGFSTEDSRTRRWLLQGLVAAENYWNADPFPMIQWYRDMRQKFRSIFGASLQHAFVYERSHLSYWCTIGLSRIPEVFYHSELQESCNLISWLRTVGNRRVVAFECDYEAMDQGTSFELGSYVLERSIAHCLPTTKTQGIIDGLEFFYRSPVLTIDSDVKYPTFGRWKTLSGIHPTNGIENYINMYLIAMSLGSVLEKSGLESTVFDWKLSVMGDDSALLIAFNDPSDAAVTRFQDFFLNEFERISNLAGETIQREKQGVSETAFCFCRRYYPVTLAQRGWKWANVTMPKGTRAVPVPAYPLDYSINSIVYPEDGPRGGILFDENNFPVPILELNRMVQLLDNGYGDPLWNSYATRVAQRLLQHGSKSDILAACMTSDPEKYQTWRMKVYGDAAWSADHSPFITFLRDRF